MTIAVVARNGPGGLLYLGGTKAEAKWLPSTYFASHYPDVRSATRAALKLPSKYRAFALPQFDGMAGG